MDYVLEDALHLWVGELYDSIAKTKRDDSQGLNHIFYIEQYILSRVVFHLLLWEMSLPEMAEANRRGYLNHVDKPVSYLIKQGLNRQSELRLRQHWEVLTAEGNSYSLVSNVQSQVVWGGKGLNAIFAHLMVVFLVEFRCIFKFGL